MDTDRFYDPFYQTIIILCLYFGLGIPLNFAFSVAPLFIPVILIFTSWLYCYYRPQKVDVDFVTYTDNGQPCIVSSITLTKSDPKKRQALIELHFKLIPKHSTKRINRFLEEIHYFGQCDKNQITVTPQTRQKDVKKVKDGVILGKFTTNPSNDRIIKITIVPGRDENNYSGSLCLKLTYLGKSKLYSFLFSHFAYKNEAKELKTLKIIMID